jgi:uncharacterized protein YdeI (YjbR/CyaY-like superfamily)
MDKSRSTPRKAMDAGMPRMRRFAAPLDANPRARKTFQSLNRQNLFALTFRTNNMKTPAGRARKIETLVAMLAKGETISPQRPATKKRRGS